MLWQALKLWWAHRKWYRASCKLGDASMQENRCKEQYNIEKVKFKEKYN